MNALLIVAHGSRSSDTEIDINLLVQEIKTTSLSFNIIERAYLEIASPSILESIELLIAKRIQSITVLPYFLSRGNHVNRDVPNIITEAQTMYPATSIRLLPHIGASAEMVNFMANHVLENS